MSDLQNLDAIQAIIDGAVEAGLPIQRASDFEPPSTDAEAERQLQHIETLLRTDSN